MFSRDKELDNWILLLLSLKRAVYLFPASVKEIGGTKAGYIDTEGNFILPPTYEQAGDFQENGLAIVQLNNQAGVINSNGYFIVKPRYDIINPFSEGRATVIDLDGMKVIDESGKVITSKSYSYIDDFKESRAVVSNPDKEGKFLYGYLNRQGKEVIPLQYDNAQEFNNGKAVITMKDGTYALIDRTGKVFSTYPYPVVEGYGEGLLVFKKSKDGKFGYIDEKGAIVIDPKFSVARSFSGERAIVSTSDDLGGKYGLIDPNGEFIIKPVYHSLLNLDEGRYALGKAIDPEHPYLGAKYALADSEGNIYTGFIYNEISTYKDGIASANNDQFTFFIDKRGKRVEHLPKVVGSGRLVFEKTLIKGDIDYRQLYFDKQGKLVWKQNNKIPITKQYSVIENKYKPNKDYLVYYPQVEGMENQVSVNQSLKELSGVKPIPAETQLESNYIGDFDVTYYRKNLLVIEIHGYDYPFGAAHGMPVKKYAHINLKSGSMYQLKDLFKPGGTYVKVLSDIIGEQIKNDEKYSYVFPDVYKGIQADQPFYISEGSVNIYFAPYEIAPYAAGFPTFTIPFDEIRGIIDQNRSFWRSFN
jgi:hypothetical protein